MLAALVLALLAVLGIERIRIDDSLSQLFRSNDPAFKQFEQVSRNFPSSEYDVLIVVSGQSLLARESVDKLRDFVADVQLIDGTRGALSMFSARRTRPAERDAGACLSRATMEGGTYNGLLDRVKSNAIPPRQAALGRRPARGHYPLARALGRRSRQAPGGIRQRHPPGDGRRPAENRPHLVNSPTCRSCSFEIRHALERDRILYNAVGFALGCLARRCSSAASR